MNKQRTTEFVIVSVALCFLLGSIGVISLSIFSL